MRDAISYPQVSSEEGCEPQRKGVKIRLQKAHLPDLDFALVAPLAEVPE